MLIQTSPGWPVESGRAPKPGIEGRPRNASLTPSSTPAISALALSRTVAWSAAAEVVADPRRVDRRHQAETGRHEPGVAHLGEPAGGAHEAPVVQPVRR